MVTNKELQESRMRSYFIEATKETLRGEGLKAVSVRTVSERAGYSFATLYNYFKDLNELIFICVQDFMDECESGIDEQTYNMNPGKERLIARMQSYVNYFTQYPGIYELFYVERMNDIGKRQPTAGLIYEFTSRIGKEDFEAMINNKEIDNEKAEIIKMSLRNSLAGLLLFYNNRLQPADYMEFMAVAKKQISISINYW